MLGFVPIYLFIYLLNYQTETISSFLTGNILRLQGFFMIIPIILSENCQDHKQMQKTRGFTHYDK